MTLVFGLRSWPEFAEGNIVSAGKPDKKRIEGMRVNFASSEAAMEGWIQA